MFEHINNIEGKDHLIFNTSGWLNYVIVMVISAWAGFVSYFQKKVGDFNWLTFLVHISSAGFAGLMAQLSCTYLGVTGPMLGVVSGIAAYTGTPTIVKLLMRLKNVQQILGAPDEAKKE